jgi:hypothetical protein
MVVPIWGSYGNKRVPKVNAPTGASSYVKISDIFALFQWLGPRIAVRERLLTTSVINATTAVVVK